MDFGRSRRECYKDVLLQKKLAFLASPTETKKEMQFGVLYNGSCRETCRNALITSWLRGQL